MPCSALVHNPLKLCIGGRIMNSIKQKSIYTDRLKNRILSQAKWTYSRKFSGENKG